MRFKVPQNVQREDKILWFITLKQLIVLMVTGGISYMLFTSLTKAYSLSQIEMILVWIPLALGAAFCFIRIKGLSLFKFGLLLLEQTAFLPPRRFWQPGREVPVSMTQNISQSKKKQEVVIEDKSFSQDKIKNLAALLDGETLPLQK